MKKKRTFIVEINETQAQNWQGSVEWVQENKKQCFRSSLELLHLISSAVEEDDKSWEE